MERRRTNNDGDFSHEVAVQEEHLTFGAMTTLSSIESVTWDNVREQTTSDPIMRHLHDTILMGFPEDSRIMRELTRIYHQYRSDLSIVEGVMLYQDRIVIPPSLRDQVLETLHTAHQDVTSMNARAKASVFWPGITIPIQEFLRHIRHRRRIVVRWRPRIHGCVNSAVPPRLGSCPPPLVGGLSSFKHPGRDRGQPSA